MIIRQLTQAFADNRLCDVRFAGGGLTAGTKLNAEV